MKELMKNKFMFAVIMVIAISSIFVVFKIINNNLEGNVIKDTVAKKEENETTKKPVKEEEIITKPLNYKLEINADTKNLDKSYDISDILYGLFLEDINFAVDAGLYAEMIKNRSFEYANLATNKNLHGWNKSNQDVVLEVLNGSDDKTFLNENNPNYAKLVNETDNFEGIYNTGYLDGISIEENKDYKVTFYAKALEGYKGAVEVKLYNKAGEVYGTSKVENLKNDWWKYEVVLTSNKTINKNVRLGIGIEKGTIAIDMISMFPVDTFMQRENGFRKDLIEYLVALNPKFLRFPGGCVIEGKTFESAYNWKDSIGDGLEFKVNEKTTVGDIAARKQGIDIWADLNSMSSHPYYVTYGIGFYEYFLLCEDIGALGIPVVNAGMTCPIQSSNYKVLAMTSDEFKQMVQDALDLVEFCKGDASTKWGAVRIAMGHEEPFELKYIGIGNEQWQEEYFAHYSIFLKAFKDAAVERPELYGDIELIVANGPASADRFGWDKVKVNGGLEYAGLVDEHFYQTPSWFVGNVDRYDDYDRNTTPVFLGEYAAKSNNLEAALAEAAFMTGIERNADIVKLACYAPLFGNNTQVQWSPNMIWFSNNSVYGSVNYYVQKIFATNVGKKILETNMSSDNSSNVLKGKVGLGTWMTEASFDNVKVVSNNNEEVLYENDFENAKLTDFNIQGGNFEIKNGKLIQKNKVSPKNETTGDTLYFGDENWTNYTFTVDAKVLSGYEGFLIPIAVKDSTENIFWNLGGWNNTVSCLQSISGGSKSDRIDGTVKDITLLKNVEYELKVVVTDDNIKCYMGKTLVIDYDYVAPESVFQTTSIDENNDIIVKLVNISGNEADVDITISNAQNLNNTAKVSQITGDKNSVVNTYNSPELVVIKDSTTSISNQFVYKLPKYSVTVLRISQD